MEGSQKKGLIVAIVFAALFLLAAGGAVFFLIDGMRVDEAIAKVDDMKFDELKSEKGELYNYKGEALTTEITDSLEDSVYHTPLGFTIISYSEKWTGQKLVEVYDELLKNGHGDEIGYLSEIVLYPQGADYSDIMDAAGERTDGDIDSYVYVDVPMLFPASLRYDADPLVSDITLYYMDRYDDVSEVAQTLAHEYGHHFTIYYFMQDDEAVRDSEYYAIRDFADYDHEVFYNDVMSYYENHMWDIYEIAAEDYVQLLGSPATKQTGEYMDGYDLLQADMDTYSPELFMNVFPQENIFIPLADEIPGLRQYYYSFISLESEYSTPLETVDFNLQISRHSKYGKRWYEITWDMVSTDPDVQYTLVCYDSDGLMYRPVRTVYGDGEAIAKVGSPVIRHGNWIYWWNDGIPRENRIFKLYMLLPDGRMIASEPFYVDF